MSNEDKIESLIHQAEDPVQRATLMVLSKLDAALESNTAATERIAVSVVSVDKQLAKHIQDEGRMLAAVRGGQYIGASFLSVILFLGGYIVLKHFERNESQDRELSAIREEMASTRRQIDVNTRRLDIIENTHGSSR